MAIYLKIEKKPETIEELLLKLFSHVHYKNDNYTTTVPTYSNPECTVLQCERHKFRSFDDIVEIVNTYFPNTDNMTVLHNLLILQITSASGIVLLPAMLMCRSIEKPTIYYSIRFERDYNGGTFTDAKQRFSNYLWKELLAELGITNFEELKNYIDKNKKETIRNEETITETV